MAIDRTFVETALLHMDGMGYEAAQKHIIRHAKDNKDEMLDYLEDLFALIVEIENMMDPHTGVGYDAASRWLSEFEHHPGLDMYLAELLYDHLSEAEEALEFCNHKPDEWYLEGHVLRQSRSLQV